MREVYMETILEIEHMSVFFTQYERGIRRRILPVIRDLTLSVGAGQIVAVVGASGSGKSLLAHGILGILPYNSHVEGTIRYAGELLTPERSAELRGREIALIPQGVNYLDPLMKIGPQLTKGSREEKVHRRTRRALERYGLGRETAEMYPFELSGGMARRVLIASAVTGTPRLIIADEPTPGLDAKAAERILGHFRELADEGAGILFITHDLELALTVADQVAVFYAGETIEAAPAEDFSDVSRLRHPSQKRSGMPCRSTDLIPFPEHSPTRTRRLTAALLPDSAQNVCLTAERQTGFRSENSVGEWSAVCIRERRRCCEAGGKRSYILLSGRKKKPVLENFSISIESGKEWG